MRPSFDRRAITLAAAAGVLFALGLLVSGMCTPAKVTAFLDVGGAWDPSLAFVMAAAIAIYAPVARLVRARRAPVFAARFHWPTEHRIDPDLVAGAAIFGVGWGLSGLCPGPALVSAGGGGAGALVFVAAMIGGVTAARLARRR